MRTKSVVCTTAHIKKRIEKDYSPFEYACMPFWRKFDFIVIDEFHSLIADATFSDTAFMMKCFIDKVYTDCIKDKTADEIKTRMIFMTGHPMRQKLCLLTIRTKNMTYLLKVSTLSPND